VEASPRHAQSPAQEAAGEARADDEVKWTFRYSFDGGELNPRSGWSKENGGIVLWLGLRVERRRGVGVGITIMIRITIRITIRIRMGGWNWD
jgi:hypothetical protein